MTIPPSDVVVTIEHPFGVLEVSLEEWMSTGPGPRPLLRPAAAKEKGTNRPLPMSVIPLRYRNNRVSRSLIALGVLPNPWVKDA